MGLEAQRLTRSGETLDVALYAPPVHRAQGPTQCLSVVVDVTQTKRHEEERAALLREAQAAVRIREDFLGVASHELKTPLTPLSLKLQALARDLEAQPDSDFTSRARSSVATCRKQVHKLSELIGDLLDVARIMGGRFALHLEELELGALVREVAARHEALAERSGSSLHLALGEGPVHGRWDRLRLEQVVTNLVDNALKYGAGRPVHVTLVQEGERAVLTVKDEGIGIPPGDTRRIFERFERAVSERHYGGLGLGLYITRTIVEGLGGHIGVVSAPGEGAAFRVELPLQPA
jgi:signal transduction histidine kinase